MAKRFLDTNFFKSPFVRSLDAPSKCLYMFVICDCSSAGIWTVDCEVASLYCGTKIDIKAARKFFVETGKATDLGNGKWFFMDFIQHQYPSGLQGTNPAHKSAIAELLHYGLIDENNNFIQAPSKPLPSSSNGAKDMVTVIDKVKDKVNTEVQLVEFARARDLYGGTKGSYKVELKNFQRHKDWQSQLPKLAPAIENLLAWREAAKASDIFVPEWKHFRTWINQRCWEDELPAITRKLTRDEKFALASKGIDYRAS